MGIFSDARFKTATFQLHIGDLLIAYTDGITEVQDRQGELWGQVRLEQLLSSCARGQPKQIVERILDEISGFADGRPQWDDMTLLVLKVEEGCDGVGLTPARVRRVTELVHAKIEDGLTLDEMAESAGLSKSYSSQMFRKSTGETPHQFVLRLRVERAQEMLRVGNGRVLDVAVACGFKTQQHFARVSAGCAGPAPQNIARNF